MSVLHYAARDGKKDICKILIQSGADLENQSNDGLVPYDYGC